MPSLTDLQSLLLTHAAGRPSGSLYALPERVSPRLLRLALAWKLQARAYGGLTRETVRLLDQLAAGRTRTRAARAGTRLVRAWGDRVHVVEVDEDGAIRWDGRSWRSLSEVARAITGTRWSGPAFFGLRHKAKAA